MFIVLLKFGSNKPDAPKHMDAHNAWIARGVEQAKFLLVGSIVPGQGGLILVHAERRDEVEELVNQDPFVIENVVIAEILEVDLKHADPRLEFLTQSAIR